MNNQVVLIMHLGCRDTGVLNAFGLCPASNLRVSWVTHPDFESFSALTGIGGTELIADSRSGSWCSTLPPASPSPSDAAPASPEGRLVTENGVCSNLGVTGGRGCHYLTPNYWDTTLHLATRLTSFRCHKVRGLPWVPMKPVAFVQAPSTHGTNRWSAFKKVAF